MRYLQIFVHVFCNYVAKIMKKSRNGFIFAVFLSDSTKKRIKREEKAILLPQRLLLPVLGEAHGGWIDFRKVAYQLL